MPPKIIFVTTIAATLTGFLSPLADYFRSLGWTIDGMASGIQGDREGASHFDHTWEASWSRDPKDRRNYAAIAEIRDVVISQQYDIVHVHTPVAGFLTRIALSRVRPECRPKIVYTAHGFHVHPQGGRIPNAVFCGLEMYAGSSTDVLIVINHEDERLARSKRLAGSGRVCYMPGIGVDLDCYSRLRVAADAVSAVRTAIGLAPSDHLFLMVAALNPGKGHESAIQALRLMWRPGIHLALAGDGPSLGKIRRQVDGLRLMDVVHFLGERRDVPTLLAGSSALLLPSVREGLPRSILEGMAMGVPIVGTRVRGIEELLAGGVGHLVELGDTTGLAEAMDKVLTQPEQTDAMIARGLRRVKRYALPRILALHHELYAGLLREGGKPTPEEWTGSD